MPVPALSEAVQASERVERERMQQDLLVTSATVIALLALIWGLIYLSAGARYTGDASKEAAMAAATTAGGIPLVYAILSFLSLGYYALTGRYHFLRFSQLFLTMIFPALLMLVLGGFVNSSAVVLWSLTSPVGAVLFSGRRQAALWFAGFLVLVAVVGLLDLGLLGMYRVEVNFLSATLITIFFIMNITGPAVVVFLLLSYFTRQRDQSRGLLLMEQAKSERLLLNVLPQPIAKRLKEGDETIAECIESASVLFADMAGFTQLSAELGVEEVVKLLNDLHSGFDVIVARHGLEKIRTMGDGYMLAAGVPIPRSDHAHALADAALEMMAFVRECSIPHAPRVHFRMGMNSGTIMAGVIGRAKFIYDVWGDPVNVASRMESHGVPDHIQISERTYDLIRDDFVCEPRGSIVIKGKGAMRTWFLLGRRPTS